MKKLLLTVTALAALSLLAPNFSHAEEYSDPTGKGYLGIYLNDGGGNWISCKGGVAFAASVTAYVVYLGPTPAVFTACRGFEAGIDLTLPGKDSQISSFMLTTFPVSSTDVGVNSIPNGTYNIIVGYSAPIAISNAAVLATLTLNYYEAGSAQIDMHLRNAIPPSVDSLTLPMFMDSSYNLHAVNMIQDGDLVAQINAPACTVVLPAEDISWGAVKSLFR